MYKIILFIFSVIFFNLCFAKNPQLYLFLGGDSAKDHIKELVNPEVEGAQIIYSWKRLEPEKNKYDFSAIKDDYKILEKYKKNLFIQLQDRSFDIKNIPVPKYLQSNKYDGGIVKQTDFAGEGQPIGAGWVTKQWNPNVKARFHKLIEQLAKEFDGKVAGVNLPETAIDINQKFFNHKFCNIYVDTIIDNMLFLKQQFKKSKAIQYVNFLPCEWNNDHGYMQRIFSTARKNKIGLGNPDTIPYRKMQMKNSYSFFKKYKSSLDTIAIAVQEPDYTYINPHTSKKFTPEELYDFDKNYLGADIIFWNIKQPEFESVLKLFANK
ncbi:hypothetical protein CGC45_03685 [Francisella opportunistica]|uniref:Uncharacterized protein n=1 Tax=Francisella opportunistica TaxID=2016517 RepID=A0A345JTQ0_9GAMM|nr:hypothetical protein CGC43_03700 [Francisella opportunistica]AXH32337.1 hypothetical protein CGC44_03665 [Francisella opportunistica]AXH33986.1 hypothetical protein CGC45_03685 [Francisella opportunistica]